MILLSLFPNFSGKTNIEKFAQDKINLTLEQHSSSTINNINIPDIPEKSDVFAQQSIGAKSAIFIDKDSGEILYEKNKDQKLSIASTTKLMTALIIYEKLKPTDVVMVPKLTTRPLDSVMGISEGQKFKVSELLHGLLIESGSDAATSLSIATATNENNFVALMNEKANLLGLTNTQFTNSVGYDSNSHFSTASDLAKLSLVFLNNKYLSEITAKTSYVAISEDGQKFNLSNTNQLLNGTTYKGLKTGTTFSAGECLISYYQDGDKKIIGVILGSNSRFYETDKTIQWIKSTYLWSQNINIKN